MIYKKILKSGLIGLMALTVGCTQAPTAPVEPTPEAPEVEVEAPTGEADASEEDAQPDVETIFKGKITSIDEENKMLTVDIVTPYQDVIILNYGDDTEFSVDKAEMLRVGGSIRFETNGTMTMSIPAQMTALKITDAWVEYDDHEKIQNMFLGREDRIASADRIEMELKKGDEFLVQLYRADALDTSWYWEVSDEGAFEYQEQAQYQEIDAVASLYQIKAIKRGEHYLYFHEYNPATGETLRDVTFQLFVLDSTNTQGNIVELSGEVLSTENDTIVLKSGDKEHWIYAPNMSEDFSFIQPGDKLIVGAEIGEASYQLAYAVKKAKMETEAGLPIIQHVVQIERVWDDQIDVLWNEALLTIYHNDLVTSDDMVGAFFYVEYAVDKANEANELLKIELIK